MRLTSTTLSAGESSGSVMVTVERVHGVAGPISIDYRVMSGSATAGAGPDADVTAVSGTLTFLDGQTTKSFTIPIAHDTSDEPDETATITLSSPLLGASISGNVTATLTIADDDLPPTDPGPGPGPGPGPVQPLTYVLAEGATGSFFQTEIALANPNTVAAPVTITFLKEGGGTVTQTLTLAATSHRLISVSAIAGMEETSFSTVVESTAGVPLVVERTMAWDASRYGAHSDAAASGPASTWYFAEGAQGFFHTYLLLANSSTSANTATVEFLLEGGTQVVSRTYDLAPSSRATVYAGDILELQDRAFGIVVKFTAPGVAERATYFGGPALFTGGHESLGVTAPATRWFHAEGATGTFFDTFLLLANPGAADATVTFRFLPATGSAVTTTRTVPAHGRLSVNVELEDPSLADAAVATEVTSDQPIISERSMYWPGPAASWHEAHNSFGATATATKWGLADGRVGGAHADQTYILLANPSDTATAHVTIAYLKDDGTTLVRTYDVAPASRFNVSVNGLVPELVNEGFGASITSDLPIFVERATYSDAGGVVWAAGTVVTATRLP